MKIFLSKESLYPGSAYSEKYIGNSISDKFRISYLIVVWKKICIFLEMYNYSYSVGKISVLDVVDGNCNGHDEKHCLKYGFHCKQYSSPLCVRVLSASRTLLIIY